MPNKKQFNYVVSFYRIVDVHMKHFHNNRVSQYCRYHMVAMENHTNMCDMYYFKTKTKTMLND